MYLFKITELFDKTYSYFMIAESYIELLQKLKKLKKNVPQQIELIAEQSKEDWEFEIL